MNQLKKLNAMHKLTMLTIQGAVVLKEGCKIYEGWEKVIIYNILQIPYLVN